jgi:hypothetical protein
LHGGGWNEIGSSVGLLDAIFKMLFPLNRRSLFTMWLLLLAVLLVLLLAVPLLLLLAEFLSWLPDEIIQAETFYQRMDGAIKMSKKRLVKVFVFVMRRSDHQMAIGTLTDRNVSEVVICI